MDPPSASSVGATWESDGRGCFPGHLPRVLSHHMDPSASPARHVILFQPLNHCYARADYHGPSLGRCTNSAVWRNLRLPVALPRWMLSTWRPATHTLCPTWAGWSPSPQRRRHLHMQVRPGGLVALSDRGGRHAVSTGHTPTLSLGSSPMERGSGLVLQRCPA